MNRKTINRLLTSLLMLLLIFGIFACGNDSSTSSMFTRIKTDYGDLHVYKGTAKGADTVNFYTNESWDRDSLCQTRVTYGYFGAKGNDLLKQNKISFEFLGDNNELLSFIDEGKGQRILSTYIYKDDSLFILKDGVDPVFVANKEVDGSFYRTISLRRAMVKSIAEPLDSIQLFDGKKMLDLKTTLEFAGFANGEAMKNVKDTIMWCNVKYIYR